MQVVNRIYSNL